jgi:CubicO group peptidase (beta-lactamase class C family)
MSKVFTRKRVVRSILLIVLIAAGYFGYTKREYIEQIPIGCAFKAKALCAGVFVQGLDPERIVAEDSGFNPVFKLLKAKIDRDRKTVSCSLLGTGLFKKTAVYIEGLGPILLSGIPEDTVRAMKPDLPAPEPADPAAVPWPMGDLMPDGAAPVVIDAAKLEQAVDKVFAEPDPKHLKRTRAIVVLLDGHLVAERYAPGIARDTRLLSWSMAKSFTNVMVGILVRQGKLDIHAPAPVPEWKSAGDPRSTITVDQLMRMSSGLDWFEEYAEHPVSDVNRMLFLEPDHAAYAAAKKLAVPPDTLWSYSSGTTNIVSRIIRDIVGSREVYWAFPRLELFNKIGMRGAVFGTDATGTFIGSSYLYATARDFARFGLFCLNDGVWNGERLLPEGWMAYSTTPTPKAEKGVYGAFFWTNQGPAGHPENREFPKLPPDLFWADGYQGQHIFVCPSLKLVAVRLGMTWDSNWSAADFLDGLAAAVGR